jgi:MFS transporter, MHS family, alpha-ketoglutarate permease
VPAAEALTAGPIALAFFAVLQPPAGMLSDRVGRKPLIIVFAAGFAVGVVPLLALVSSVFGVLLLVQCVGMVLRSPPSWCGTGASGGIGFPHSLIVACSRCSGSSSTCGYPRPAHRPLD